MEYSRKKTFCLLTIAGLGICIGMSNSESPISEKKPPVIVQEVEQKPEVVEKENILNRTRKKR